MRRIQIGIRWIAPQRSFLFPYEADLLLGGLSRLRASEQAKILSADRRRVEVEAFVALVQDRVGRSVLSPLATFLLAEIVRGGVVFRPEEANALSLVAACARAISNRGPRA